MPVIQQENGRKSVKGLPLSWGDRAYRALKAAQAGSLSVSEQYKKLSALLDDVVDAPLPIDSTDAQICILAQKCAAEAQAYVDRDVNNLHQSIESLFQRWGIEPTEETNERKFLLRACDPAFWRRNLRKAHGRNFEHAAIRLGFVSIKSGAYCSSETVARHIAQKRRNKNLLSAVKVQNETTGQVFDVQSLADKTTSNQTIRRGELMLRLAGCEEVADKRGDVGLFVTRTLSSRFHAIMAKSGEQNPKYEGASPKDAAQELQTSWERVRAELHRLGIKPYGFRMAEPHHDGCPHWHMMLFVKPCQVKEFSRVLSHYALQDAPEEVAHDHSIRIKIEEIKKEKGSACAYLAKYISKNIGDEHVSEHVDSDGVITSTEDLAGDVIKPFQRVAAWASVWGIRQFQPIGQPPVMAWREIRRVLAETVQIASPAIKKAWQAAQRIEVMDSATQEKKPIKAANYADYIDAQGGVCLGRKYKIGVAVRHEEIEGRYGLAPAVVPVGVYERQFKRVGKKDVLQPAHEVYESVRYRWKRVSSGVEVAFTWSPVNNCTEIEEGREAFWAVNLPIPDFYEFEAVDYGEELEKFIISKRQKVGLVIEARREAVAKRNATVWTRQNKIRRGINARQI